MAKQDLVVKLLLDSGAFGNDLRTAERKAQQFSNSIQSAGRTAGELGKEVGLTTGALGKLGGVLTGAGAVVAAVGAFKSVMESTNESSKKFHSTIAGFEGVLTAFQRSLASGDWSTWTNGIYGVAKAAKEAKIAMIEAERTATAYGVVSAAETKQMKSFELSYRNAMSAEERETIRSEAETFLQGVSENANRAATSALDSVLSQLHHINPNINTKNDPLKGLTKPTFEDIQRLLLDASQRRVDGRDKADIRLYEALVEDIEAKTKEWKKAEKKDPLSPKAIRLRMELDEMLYDPKNQELMIRNALYSTDQEQFNALNQQMREAEQIMSSLSEKQLQFKGWSAGSSDESPTAAPGSIKALQEAISKLETQRDLLPYGSASWEAKTRAIVEQKEELEELVKQQKMHEDGLRTLEVQNVNSIQYLQEMVSYYENLRDTLDVGSAEWWEASDTADAYNTELKALLETQKALIEQYDKTPIPPPAVRNVESIQYIQEMISFYEDLRDTLSVGSVEWIEASDALDSYKVELEGLLEMQAAYDAQYKPAEKYEDMNVALSSSIDLLNGLGSAFSASESQAGKALGSIMQAMSATAGGIMDFIQIKQAAAAAAGASSAAGMPYPYNLAAIASVVATVLSVFGSIKSMVSGKFAEGGIVGGTSYSGDKLFAMVNSGEMILNKRQQGNLANMFGGGGQVEFHISGDSLVGVLNNRQNKRNLTR